MKIIQTLPTVFFLVFPLIFFSPNAAEAAMTAYLTLEGETGLIKGPVEQVGREGAILVYSVGHNIHFPYDQATGQPSGPKTHTPYQILKAIDMSTPLLNKVLVTNEKLTTFELNFYRIDEKGQEENYYRIKLDNAKIVKIAQNTPPTFLEENKPYHDMETVSFVYSQIYWMNPIDGVTQSDSWISQ